MVSPVTMQMGSSTRATFRFEPLHGAARLTKPSGSVVMTAIDRLGTSGVMHSIQVGIVVGFSGLGKAGVDDLGLWNRLCGLQKQMTSPRQS